MKDSMVHGSLRLLQDSFDTVEILYDVLSLVVIQLDTFVGSISFFVQNEKGMRG